MCFFRLHWLREVSGVSEVESAKFRFETRRRRWRKTNLVSWVMGWRKCPAMATHGWQVFECFWSKSLRSFEKNPFLLTKPLQLNILFFHGWNQQLEIPRNQNALVKFKWWRVIMPVVVFPSLVIKPSAWSVTGQTPHRIEPRPAKTATGKTA